MGYSKRLGVSLLGSGSHRFILITSILWPLPFLWLFYNGSHFYYFLETYVLGVPAGYLGGLLFNAIRHIAMPEYYNGRGGLMLWPVRCFIGCTVRRYSA